MTHHSYDHIYILTPIKVEKDDLHKVMMGSRTRRHPPHLRVIMLIMLRLGAKACRGERIPRQGTGRIMERIGVTNNGDQVMKQWVGGAISIKAGEGSKKGKEKAGKVA